MKNYILPTLLIFVFATAHATITININTTGWGDNNSAGVNDLAWGILIDSDTSATGGSFAGSFSADLAAGLDGFVLPSVSGFGGTAAATNVFSEYYFIQSNSLTVNGGPAYSFADGLMESLGGIYDANVNAGDDYGLIWFSKGTGTLGSSDFYGFQDLGVLPSDGNTIDPVTTSGQSLTAIGVPEPSAFAAITAIMTLGFVMVRRRRG
jgi:hypothetical protein